MACKDAIEFRRLPSPRKLLQYAQRRWPITVAKHLKRKAAKMLASICWTACCATYRKMPALAVKLGVEKAARHTWRTLHPWSEWRIEMLTQPKHWDDVYAAYAIAYAAMTVEDRIALARNTPAIVPNVGLEQGYNRCS